MKRFWLLLLAFVLPLQMTWAAMHLCGGSSTHSTSEVAQFAADQHSSLSSLADEGPDPIEISNLADSCGAGHGCHGLHTAMLHPAADLPIVLSASFLSSIDSQLALRQFVQRHERPQWFAA